MSFFACLLLALAAPIQAEEAASTVEPGYRNDSFGIEAELFPFWTVQDEKVRKHRLVVTFGMPPSWSDARGGDVIHEVTVTADSGPEITDLGDKFQLEVKGFPPFAFLDDEGANGEPRGSLILRGTFDGVAGARIIHLYYENGIAYLVEMTVPNAELDPALGDFTEFAKAIVLSKPKGKRKGR